MSVLGRNADPEVVRELLARIRDPHVAPINALSDKIALAEGLEQGVVPYVDPDMGGIRARALVLLDNPSTMAESGTGSGLLSLDNNDWTARNCREAYAVYGVEWHDVVHWNVCPFPTSNIKNGRSKAGERHRAVRWTRELVALLPRLEIVLPLGGSARDGWRRADQRPIGVYDFAGREIPHCGHRGLNRTPDSRRIFHEAIRDMAQLLG
ncbi:uracil-DNA glycosylase [Nocardia sp. NPDC058379]|uniref:uracil-DNA glycosylase n=1 Tax=unclassified Nocardia TaxID=2637762 RepID=UPI00364E6084